MFKSKATAVKPLTTLLGALFEKAGIDLASEAYNGKTIANPQPKLVGQYEAALTQASYMSRLAYERNDVKLACVQLLNTNPIIFNTATSLIKSNIKNLRGSAVPAMKFVRDGSVIYKREKMTDAPCHFQVLDYTSYKCGCPYPGERVLYITFRGTANMKSALTDLKASPRRLDTLLSKAEMYGVGASAAFLDAGVQFEEKGFQAHGGFVSSVALIISEICRELEYYLNTAAERGEPIHRIIVTGHSLGGAKASLVALVLAGFKRANVSALSATSIHCITFGAPKIFLDYSRNVFNALLAGKYLTFDRVANRADNVLSFATSSMMSVFGPSVDTIPQLPPGPYVHPGFMILKTETRTQSTSGRSRNISDIRAMYGGIVPAKGALKGLASKFMFNGLPDYVEYFNSFDTVKSLTAQIYAAKIHSTPLGRVFKTPGGSNPIYEEIKMLVNIILPVSAEETESVAAAAAQGEAAEGAGVAAPAGGEEGANEGPNERPSIQEGGGRYTDLYKAETKNQGPNHVVYMCEKNIALICHSGYTGVSYMGVLKSFGNTFENSTYVVADGKMTYQAGSSFTGPAEPNTVLPPPVANLPMPPPLRPNSTIQRPTPPISGERETNLLLGSNNNYNPYNTITPVRPENVTLENFGPSVPVNNLTFAGGTRKAKGRRRKQTRRRR
jgi:hypothetical protein